MTEVIEMPSSPLFIPRGLGLLITIRVQHASYNPCPDNSLVCIRVLVRVNRSVFLPTFLCKRNRYKQQEENRTRYTGAEKYPKWNHVVPNFDSILGLRVFFCFFLEVQNQSKLGFLPNRLFETNLAKN